MIQTVIVLLIVACAVFFAVRWIVRTVKGKGGCQCSCSGCPYSGDKNCHCNAATHLPDIDPDRLTEK